MFLVSFSPTLSCQATPLSASSKVMLSIGCLRAGTGHLSSEVAGAGPSEGRMTEVWGDGWFLLAVMGFSGLPYTENRTQDHEHAGQALPASYLQASDSFAVILVRIFCTCVPAISPADAQDPHSFPGFLLQSFCDVT